MALNFKKALLTGSALVMVGAFAGHANAAALTFTASTNTNATAADTWAVDTQTGFTNSTLTWNGAGAVGVTATSAAGGGTANVGGLTVTSVAGANTFVIGDNTKAVSIIVNSNVAGDVAANDLAVSVLATGNSASSTLQLKGTTNAFGSNGVTLDSGTGGGKASLIFSGTGAQSINGNIKGAVAGDGVLSVTNTGGTVTFSSAVGGTALGHIGTGGASGTSTTVFSSTVNVSNASGSTGGDGAIVLGQTDGGSSATTFKGAVTSNSFSLGVAGAGNDTNTVTFDASGASFSVSSAINGATANDTNNLVILGGASKVVTLAGGSNLDNISLNQAGTSLTLSGSTTGTGSITFDAAGTLNVNGGTLSFASASTVDMKNSASTVNIANGAAILGSVTSTGGANGTLNFASANLTGNVGTSAATGMALVAFNNTSGTTSTVTGNVYGTNINVTSTGAAIIKGTTNGITGINGTGSLNSFGTVTANTNFGADGTFTVGNAAGTGAGIVGAVTTTTNNTGTLAFVGTGTNTVSSGVGTASNKLKAVSVGAGNITFQSSGFYATTLSFTSSGTADLTAAGTSLGSQIIAFAGNNGTVKLGAGTNYAGTVTTTTTGSGNLNFASGSTVSGTIGTSGNKLNTLFFTDGANTISSIVHATKTDVGAATVNVTNTTFDSGVNFSANSGQITFASASTVTGNITATTPGDGTIVYSGPLTITGDVGRIKALTVVGALTINGNAVAADATDVGIQNVTVSGTYATTANTTLTYRVNTPTTSGKITSTGNATVDANTAVSMVVDTSVFVADGQQFVLIDGNNAGTGVSTLTAGKLTTTSTTLLKFKQDTTNSHDLVVIADRTASSTIASNPSNAAVGTVLDSLGGSSNPQVNALNVALGAATTSTQVDNLLASVVSPTNTSVAAVNSSAASIANVITAQIDIGSTGAISMPSFGGGSQSGKSGGNETMGSNVWFQGFGASADQGVRNGASGYDVGSYGAVAGADKEINDNLRLGVNLAYAKTNVNGRDINRTGTDVDSYQGGLYGAYDFGSGYFATGQASYMYNDMDTVRYNVGGVPGQNARANPHSSMYSARTEAGRVIAVPHGFTLTPSALANFSYTDMAKYSETGAGGLSLSNVNPDDPRMVELGLRMRAEALINDNHGGMIKPALSVGYRYDLVGDRAATVANLVGGGTSFNTTGTKPARGTAEAGAGITWVSPYTVEFKAEYDYEHKSEYNSHSGFVRAGMKF